MGSSHWRSVAVVVVALLAVRARGEEPSTSSGSEREPRAEIARLDPPPRPDVSDYAGTYVYAGTDAERAAIKASVDRATDRMFGIVIARGELMKRSEIRPSYTIRFQEPGQLSVETPGFPPECAPLDGTEVELRTKFGDVVKNSQRFVDGALLQSGRTSEGSGSTRFRLLPDGNTLLVTRTSRSPRLPGTVEYTLTYVRRQDARASR